MAPTVYLGVRVPPELLEAARTTAGRPDATTTTLIRYALAKLAGLDDADAQRQARHRPNHPASDETAGAAA